MLEWFLPLLSFVCPVLGPHLAVDPDSPIAQFIFLPFFFFPSACPTSLHTPL